MAGRDLEAVARGLEESLRDDHIRARVGQVHYLGNLLMGWDVPVVRPIGGHGVFLDARAMLPHIPQEQYPAQTLAAALHLDAGVRSMARRCLGWSRPEDRKGTLAPTRTRSTGHPPARVYTGSHGCRRGICILRPASSSEKSI